MWIDLVIISIIIVSMLTGYIRGLIHELLSCITWICAIIIAIRYYSYFTIYFISIPEHNIRNTCVMFILFLMTLIMGNTMSYLINALVNRTYLARINHILGVGFGLLRGILIIAILLYIIQNYTILSYIQVWKQSQLIPKFRYITIYILKCLQYLRFF